MRTTHRIAKKRAALFAAGYSCAVSIGQARPSFWTLDTKAQAQALAGFVKKNFHTPRATANRAARFALARRKPETPT